MRIRPLSLNCFIWISWMFSVFFVSSSPSHATSNQRMLGKKLGIYQELGVFSTGDAKQVNDAIKEARLGKQKDFERFVFEFESPKEAPYSEVSLDPKKQQLTVTFFGQSERGKTGANWDKLERSSDLVEKIRAYPKLEGLSMRTFVFDLKSGVRFEAFRLSAPERLVLDLREFAPPAARVLGPEDKHPAEEESSL